MKNNLTLILALFTYMLSVSQTFNSSTNINIPAYQSICVPIIVFGVGNISDTYGIEQVCIDLQISSADEVHISLQSPDGNEYYLSYIEWEFHSDYTNTCFNSGSTNPIWLGSAPYTGTYQPETHLGVFNNGQNADALWYICFDNIGSSAATLNSSSLLFSSNLSSSCGAVAEDNCNSAPLICDFNGYCGTTSSSYTVPASESTGSEAITGCGFSLDNNSWTEFVPNNDTVTIEVDVTDCMNSDGVQFGVWESTDCSSFTKLDCAPSNPLIGLHTMTFTDLTPYNSYYLMIDGYAGDVCNYSFSVNGNSGVSVVQIDQGANLNACPGEDVVLTVPNIPGVTYTWNWGANTSSGSSITINNVSPPFVVNVTAHGACENISDQININSCCANAGQWE